MSDQTDKCQSLHFDEVAVIPCACGSETESGTTPQPSTDDRCADPAFAVANPTICGGYPRLILKPDVLCLGVFSSVQLKTYLYANGTEVLLTNGLEYVSSDNTVASVGVNGGKVMGVDVGICFITVKWQNLTAYCQVNIAASTVTVGLMALVDNSLSMSQSFGAPYPSKLEFAKAGSRLLATELNTQKDFMGVISFNEAGTLRKDLSEDTAALKTAINGITNTNLKTDIDDALAEAITALDVSTIDRPVIILFTDGENKYGANPIIRANEFKNKGGVIMVVAVRAHGLAYDSLVKIASGGFFLNATSTTYAAALSYLSGLKGYLCAGNCVDAGDVILPQPQFDYDGFYNWNVTGHVDLIGDWLWDLLPGNGLYVDMVGGKTAPYKGKLTSKTSFNLVAGQQYRLSLFIAGNQRFDDGTYQLVVKLGTVINQTVTITNWKQDFTEYGFVAIVTGNEAALISIEQTIVPPIGPNNSNAVGLLIGKVKLENLTAATTLLYDDFDDENPTYIPPRCGISSLAPYGGMYYGTSCYGKGCLSAPPTEQVPDPSPLTDIEV